MKRWSFALVLLIVGGLGGTVLTGTLLQGQAPVQRAQPRELETYREVVRQVLPAVVSVEVKAKPAAARQRANPRRQPGPDDPRIPDEFRRFFDEIERRRPDSLDDVPSQGLGSGVIVDPKGVVLTNYHVVAGADQVEVTLKDGRKFSSRDIKGDRKTDLAIVRINPDKALPTLRFADSDAAEIGDRVLAVGAPFGLIGSVTHGIVSGKGRNMNLNMYEDFIQTDAAINPGNSGGPLVNLNGEILGINTAIKSRNGGFQGVGFAISSNMAKNIMQQLERNGVVRRGYLGVQIRELTPEVADRLGVPSREGVLISGVFDNSPAGKAGIKEGDVVTHIAGKQVRDNKELQRMVANLPLRKPTEVVVTRDGKAVTLSVTIEEQPEDYGTRAQGAPAAPRRDRATESVSVGKLGLEVADLTPELAEQFGYKEGTTGPVISRVSQDDLADAGGLRRGMLIVKVDKNAVASATAAREALEKASLEKGILLQVTSPEGGTNFVVLQARGN